MPRTDRKLRKLAIVPAYNEGEMVARVVRDIHREAPGFDVLVVDDGSTDATAMHAESEGAIVIRHPYNLGIGGAVQSGYKYALRNDYDVAVQVDGDGQHKPEYLPKMLRKLQTGGKADMVYGSRFRGDPGYKVPLGRRAGNMIFSIVLTALTRKKITDPTSGFRMTNRRGIELFARDYPHDYPEVEALLMLHAHHLRIHEVHVKMNARGFGDSSIDYPRSAYYMVKVLLALFVGLFRRRPTPVEATGEEEPGVRPRRGGLTMRLRILALALVAALLLLRGTASADTLHGDQPADDGPGLARADDPRRRPRRHDRDPAGHLPARKRRHADRAAERAARGGGRRRRR